MSLLNFLGITNAMAQNVPSTTQAPPPPTGATEAATHTGSGMLSMIWMIAAFIIIFYFLLIRPQSKRAKEQRKLLDGLQKGDEVVTTAGLVGRISRIEADFVVLNVADNVELTFQKNAIAGVLPKGTIKGA